MCLCRKSVIYVWQCFSKIIKFAINYVLYIFSNLLKRYFCIKIVFNTKFKFNTKSTKFLQSADVDSIAFYKCWKPDLIP